MTIKDKKMTAITPDRVKELIEHFENCATPGSDVLPRLGCPKCDEIRSILDAHAALRGEVERLRADLEASYKRHDYTLGLLKKAEAEVERLSVRLKDTETWWRNAQNYAAKLLKQRDGLYGPLAQAKARAESAEAELEAARPLLEAYENVSMDGNGGIYLEPKVIESIRTKQRAALAFRQRKEKGEPHD